MRVLIWGLGYVGTVTGTCLAQLGHEVVGIELDPNKVKAVNEGRSLLKEPGLDEMMASVVENGNFRAAEDGTSLVPWADVSMICVGTPSSADGRPILDHVEHVAEDIGKGLRAAENFHVVALRSTVYPSTTRSVLLPLLEKYSGRMAGQEFGLAMNPEFLREGNAVEDVYAPPYTVIGEYDAHAGDVVEALYAGVDAPVHRVELEEAELLKLVNNAFHALKIGFANEVGRICDTVHVDSHKVMDLVCADKKLNISSAYLQPGFAFGGSCLPKDLRSISYHAGRAGLKLPILENILSSNRLQLDAVLKKISEMGSKRVGVLGLSFKPDTDDLRESPVIDLVRQLWQNGVDVVVYDPLVVPAEMLGSNLAYLQRQLPQIDQILAADIETVLESCDTIVVTQNRSEFAEKLREPDTDVVILDLVRLGSDYDLENEPNYTGLSW